MNHIGVAVPTLNAGSTLAWTLLSLRQQVGCRVDPVVVDSGSTDATLSVCAEAGVRTIFEPPGNMYRAVNAALRSLDAPWLAYLNADDVAYSDAYSVLLDVGERTGADVVYGNCDYVDYHGRFLFTLGAAPNRLLKWMYQVGTMPFSQPCAVFRRAVFDRLGGFDARYRHIGDLDFFSRALQSGARFVRVSGFSVVAFRQHQGQLSFRENPVVQEELARCTSEQRSPLRWLGNVARWQWQLANAGHYLTRRLRTGQWSDRPPRGGEGARRG